MEKLNSLVGLRLAALRSKGYTAEQIATLTQTLQGIFEDINNSLKSADDHIQSAHAPANAEENTIVCIKKNGAAVAPKDKIVDLLIPTKLSELTNDSDYATTQEVAQTVNGAGHLKAVVVSALPATSSADKDTIYFVQKSSGEAGNQYHEYKLVNGTFELIGETKADLSGYATKTYVAKADDALIRSIFDNTVSEEERYIGSANLALFWSLVKPLLATVSMDELAARVELLELAVLNGEIAGNPFYVTFESLTGLSVQGVWNQNTKRIEY